MEVVIVKDKADFFYALPQDKLQSFKDDCIKLQVRELNLKYNIFSMHQNTVYLNRDEPDAVYCSATGEKMNEGWVTTLHNQNFYFKHEKHALQWCKENGFSSLDEAFNVEDEDEVYRGDEAPIYYTTFN